MKTSANMAKTDQISGGHGSKDRIMATLLTSANRHHSYSYYFHMTIESAKYTR